MSEHNPIQQLALELAALRREIASLHQERGTRLSRAQVCARLGIHRNTLPRYMAERRFPTPCSDGSFLLGEIIEWEAQH